MNSETIYDAITNINDELLDAADISREVRKQRLRKRNFRLASIALVTAAAILVGIIFGPGTSSTILKAQAVAVAEYPEMVQYPKELSENELSFRAAYSEWYVSLEKQQNRATVKYSDKLNGYVTNTLRTFLSDTDGENRSISPLNLYMALGMLAEITDGNSRAQLLDVLECSTVEELRSTASSVWNNNYRNDGIATTILASSLWLDKDIRYNSDTLETLSDTYYASSYSGEPGSPEFDTALQNWLSEQTGGLLDEQISDISMDPLTVIALATTVQFRAKWDSKFLERYTSAQTFHTPDEDIMTDFMHNHPYQYNDTYYWGDNFSAVCLDFDSGGYMKIILPDEDCTPDDLLADEEALSFIASKPSDWENQKCLKVNMAIPKFDISSQLELTDGLKKLGITDLFDPECSDYSPLTKKNTDPIALSEALHGTRVTIDEEGCTAVAYTFPLATGDAPPPEDEVDFVADRPFLFVISYKDDLPLFAGVVNQP